MLSRGDPMISDPVLAPDLKEVGSALIRSVSLQLTR
jgi:hypothetical protein